MTEQEALATLKAHAVERNIHGYWLVPVWDAVHCKHVQVEGAVEAAVTLLPWVVVQNAGYTNERIVHEARTYDDAYCAMHEMYQPDEQEELHVDIMRRLENGDLTTEY